MKKGQIVDQFKGADANQLEQKIKQWST